MRSFIEMIKEPTVRVLCWDNWPLRFPHLVGLLPSRVCFGMVSLCCGCRGSGRGRGRGLVFLEQVCSRLEQDNKYADYPLTLLPAVAKNPSGGHDADVKQPTC